VEQLKVAYLINQYPMVSHSFIRREILALERQGVEVLRVSMRGWDGDLVDAEDIRECRRTLYVLRGGMWALLPAVLGMALRAPVRFLAALRLALRMSRDSHRALAFHLVYLAEACWIVPRLHAAGMQHLHAHFGTNPAEVAMLVHRLCGVPYSFTVHGIAELDKPEAIGLAEKIRRAAFVVAVSSFCRAQLYRWTEEDHWSKVKVVRCGLEPAFHEGPAAAMPVGPRLVCVARLSGEKGQLLLVRAAAVLARDGVDFELVLAGDGEMRARIEAEIIRFGLERNVRITGWISSAQVREEIQAARALVLPSFAEGLPVVIMEAMALRRPVLTTFVAGIPELVVHGENGWLFPAGALDELAAAMKACLATPPQTLEKMGSSARERVLVRHDVDREAKRLAGYFCDAARVEPAKAQA
jgi:glycosyltransferase involved in cell wall biosynthesis